MKQIQKHVFNARPKFTKQRGYVLEEDIIIHLVSLVNNVTRVLTTQVILMVLVKESSAEVVMPNCMVTDPDQDPEDLWM